MGKNIFYFVIAIAFILAIGGIIFYLVQPSSKQEVASPVQVEEEPQGLGGEIYDQGEDPADNIRIPNINRSDFLHYLSERPMTFFSNRSARSSRRSILNFSTCWNALPLSPF